MGLVNNMKDMNGSGTPRSTRVKDHLSLGSKKLKKIHLLLNVSNRGYLNRW